MTDISKEEVEKLFHLCRIACSEEEKDTLKTHLSRTLAYMEELNAINTEGVEPCYHVLASHKHLLREDCEEELLTREDYLANTVHVGGLIRVPPVMKE